MVDYRHETARALLDAEGELLAAHGDLMHSPASEVEGLDRAACSAHISNLARLALGASYDGVSAEQWRTWVRDDRLAHGHQVDQAWHPGEVLHQHPG